MLLALLATPALAGLSDGLVRYLPFDGALQDLSPQGVNATLFAGTAKYTTGKLGQAAAFANNGATGSGPSDWAASLGNLESVYAGSFSLSLWVRTTATTDAALLGNKNWTSGSNVGWVFATTPNKNLNFNTSGGTRRDVSLNPPMADGSWHLVTLVFDRTANLVRSYVDGALKDSRSIATLGTAALTPSPAFATLVGASGPGTWAGKGDLDDLGVWSRALSAAEVALIYQQGQQGLPLIGGTGADTVAPTAPTSLTATAAGTQVNLTWTAATDNVAVTGYRVLRNGTQIGTATTTTYADSGLTVGQTYNYTVVAIDAAANASAASTAATATATDIVAPTAPTSLTATVTGAQVNLTWIAATDNVAVAGYRVLRNGVHVGTATATAYTDTGLAGGQTYSYTVVAIDSAGNASFAGSAAVVALPGATGPLTAGLTKYFPFDGSLANWGAGPGDGAPFAGTAKYAAGRFGQAVSFANNASSSTPPSDWALSLGDLEAIYAADFTLSLWVKTSSTADAGVFGNKNWASGSNTGWVVSTYGGKNLNWRAAGGTRRDVSLNPPFADGTWHLATFTFSRSANRVVSYIDGVAKDSRTLDDGTGAGSLAAGYPTLVGASGPGTLAAKADVDDLAVWSRTLDAAEVARIFSLAQQGVTLGVQQTLEAVPPVLSLAAEAKRVLLRWTPSQVEVGTIVYRLYRDDVKIAETTAATYTDAGVTPATAYAYRVEAVGLGGRTLGSATVAATTLANQAPAFWGLGGHYPVAEGAAVGTALGEVKAIDPDGDAVTYRLVSGSGVAVDAGTGALSLTAVPSLADGAQRVITIEASDGVLASQAQFSVLAVRADRLAHAGASREEWLSLSGDLVTDLTGNSRFPSRPDKVSILTGLATPNDTATQRGNRLRAYLRPAQSGAYRFWISGDDAAELRLAGNADPGTLDASPLAGVPDTTAVNAWEVFASQRSVAVNLVRGQAYYVEVLHKQGWYSEHVEVAWQGPGMTAPTLIGGTDLLAFDALDAAPPKAPESLARLRVDGSGVTLSWTKTQDAGGISQYRILRDGVLIGTVDATVQSYTDLGVSGVHDYAVIAVDGYGNASPPTRLAGVDAGQAMDAVAQAVAAGNPAYVLDAIALVDAALAEIAARRAASQTFFSGVYPAGTTVAYAPGQYSQQPTPTGANAGLQVLLPGNQGYPLALAGTAQGARFAAYGSVPTALFQSGKQTSYQEPFKRVLAWLLTGSPGAVASLAGTHRAALVFADSASSTRNWLKAQTFGGQANQWTLTDCTAAATIVACIANQEVLILGHAAGDTDAPAILAAVEAALARGVPVLVLHDSWGTNALSDGLGSLFGYSLPYGGNYWDNDAANWADGLALAAGADATGGLAPLQTLLTHLKNGDWSVDLSSSDSASLQSEFYDGARETLKARLNALDGRGFDLFAKPDQRLNQLLVLLGDLYRRDIRYPLDAATTPQDTWLRAYFADHAVYNNRAIGPAQPDLGNFSKPIPADVPRYTEDLSFTSRADDHFTAAGVYALPGATFTVERLDTGDQPVQIAINSLRTGSTHEFDRYGYSRPKYLRSAWIAIEPGQTLTLTSPYGGPVQVQLDGSATPATVELRVSGVGHHPVWGGPADTQAFADGLTKGDYSWAEFLTPGFEVHSTRAYLLETLSGPLTTTPDQLAAVTWRYFYQGIYNLAGFIGDDLAPDAQVLAVCNAKGWDCTDPLIHGLDGMQHMNADQATCGAGCSGNPYDAYWAFEPLSWGDAHEAGHGLQRGRLKVYDGASGEVSNNIFPIHTVYEWNREHPAAPQTGRRQDQEGVFAMFQTALAQSDPIEYVHQTLWVNGDVFWRLQFYQQLAFQAHDLPQFGDGGWDLFPLLYLQERLFGKAIGDDTAWAANKAKLGFTQYDRAGASAMTGNDYLLIATSFLTAKDQRPFFDLWGITYSTAAAGQVASFGYGAAERRFYVLPKAADGNRYGSTDAVGSVLVTSGATLP